MTELASDALEALVAKEIWSTEDHDEILARLKTANPLADAAVERSIRATVTRVERWPRSARVVRQWKQGNV